MLKNHNIRVGIISGIITSLIVIIFIEPILNLMWDGLKSSGIFLFNKYVDTLYRNAALGLRDVASFQIFLTINSIGLGMFVSFIMWINMRFKDVQHDIKILDSDNTEDDLNKVQENILNEVGKLKVRMSKVKKILMLQYLFGFILTIILTDMVLKTTVDFQLNTSFSQRLKSISHLISDQVEEELESQWARMKTKSDYEEINGELNRIANENKLELPEPLW